MTTDSSTVTNKSHHQQSEHILIAQ